MTYPIDRIKEFIQHKNLSLNAFDVSIERPRGYSAKQIRNKGSIGSEILSTILRVYPELNIHWVITGEGEMLRKDFIKLKSIDEIIEDKIEAKLKRIDVTIEDLKTLLMVKEFSETKKQEIQKIIDKSKA